MTFEVKFPVTKFVSTRFPCTLVASYRTEFDYWSRVIGQGRGGRMSRVKKIVEGRKKMGGENMRKITLYFRLVILTQKFVLCFRKLRIFNLKAT
jgi:hypothetical protein